MCVWAESGTKVGLAVGQREGARTRQAALMEQDNCTKMTLVIWRMSFSSAPAWGTRMQLFSDTMI
jgi:hypothetical protein